MGVVHDTRAWRSAVEGVVRATAAQHAERLNERLQLYALETFSPLAQNVGRNASTPAAGLTALAASQRAGEKCNCRNMIPVAEFFRADLATGQITRLKTEGQYSAQTAVNDSQLASIANVDASKFESNRKSPVRLTVGGTLDRFAVVTNVTRDSANASVAVHGFVAEARPLIFSLFAESAVQLVAHDSNSGVIRLDTLSLQVGHTDSTPIYGRLSPDRSFRAKVFLHGPMDGLGLNVAIDPSQTNITYPFRSNARLWALGAFMSATLLVIIIAVTTAKREFHLARARSDFIAGTSHDLRMPLAQILLAGETLTLHPDVSERERAALSRSIVRETRRLVAMVENVLLYSRSGAVGMKPSLQTLSVAESLESVRESVQLALDDRNQQLAFDVPANLSMRADRHLIRQAFVNLVDNAMKYGREHQTIRVSALQSPNEMVQILVDDEGKGIPASQRARIFEPYERLTRDQVSEHAGSGLGLAVVYHIVKVCGGNAWVTDAPGGGARFVIELKAAAS